MKDFDGKISVIMPAYNEQAHIGASLLETTKVLGDMGFDHEIIVVDDGSRDNTYREALKVATEIGDIQVVQCQPNWGKGAALKYGFRFATGDLVAFLDADLDLHPKHIQTLFNYMKKDNADVVIGSKRHPLSKLNYPLHRRFMSTIYYGLTKILFGLPIKDTQTGIKLFRHRVLHDIFPKVLVKRYAFDLELLVNAHHKGYKIAEAPITLNSKRKFGRINPKDIYHILMDTMAIFYRLYILRYYDKATNFENS